MFPDILIMSKYYHYTDADSCSAIVQSGHIKQSIGDQNAVFGDGVYLTTIGPQHSTAELVLNNYDRAGTPAMAEATIEKYRHKIDRCIEFDSQKIGPVTQVGTDRLVYLHKEKDLQLDGTDYKVHVSGDSLQAIKNASLPWCTIL